MPMSLHERETVTTTHHCNGQTYDDEQCSDNSETFLALMPLDSLAYGTSGGDYEYCDRKWLV